MRSDKEIVEGLLAFRLHMTKANAIKKDMTTTTLLIALDLIIGDKE